MVRAAGGDVPSLTRSGGIGGGGEGNGGGGGAGNTAQDGSIEWTMMSPNVPQRECCAYLFQRGMVVSEEGVRGGQDHLRNEQVSGNALVLCVVTV